MIRFALANIAVASALFLSAAHAQTPPSVTGEWIGKYICTQGVTSLNLTVTKGDGAAIKATFSFGPLPENPEVPKGAYQMRGTYDPATRSVKLDGVKWIDAPLGYVMVGLDGHMTPSGQKIAGHVPDLPGCTGFEVWRPVELIG